MRMMFSLSTKLMDRLWANLTDEQQQEEIREENQVRHLASRNRDTSEVTRLWIELSKITRNEVCEK